MSTKQHILIKNFNPQNNFTVQCYWTTDEDAIYNCSTMSTNDQQIKSSV